MCKSTAPCISGRCVLQLPQYQDNVVGPGSPKYDNAYFEISYVRTYTTSVAAQPGQPTGASLTNSAPLIVSTSTTTASHGSGESGNGGTQTPPSVAGGSGNGAVSSAALGSYVLFCSIALASAVLLLI